jgi:hypothetical protein
MSSRSNCSHSPTIVLRILNNANVNLITNCAPLCQQGLLRVKLKEFAAQKCAQDEPDAFNVHRRGKVETESQSSATRFTRWHKPQGASLISAAGENRIPR